MTEREVDVDGRTVRVHCAGDPDGAPVLYCHGTPGSRLDVAFGEAEARRLGVRLISFDRPWYGGSAPAEVSLRSVAGDVAAIADTLGLERFAVLGWSGGGPYALAAAAVLGERVAGVAVACGPGPAAHVPGALESFTENDRLALSLLPGEPARAAEQFRAGNADMLDLMLSVRDDPAAPWIDWIWGESDPAAVRDPALRAALFEVLHEGMRQGADGVAWDNVAWTGPWGIDLADVRCPVALWYGARDSMVPLAHGEWLRDHLPRATLTLLEDEGHLLAFTHWTEILRSATG